MSFVSSGREDYSSCVGFADSEVTQQSEWIGDEAMKASTINHRVTKSEHISEYRRQ